MTRSTEELIASLAADIAPVRRLQPPMTRALVWIAAIAALAAIAVSLFSNLAAFVARASHPALAMELAATLLTAVAAVIAAFHLSLPDRSRAWALLPLPPLAAWLLLSGSSCWRVWSTQGLGGGGGHCLLFIVGASLPTGALLFWGLSRSRPISPGLTAIAGGLGVAAASAFILQFFHPFDVTAIDLALHLVAVALVVAIASTLGKRALA